MISRTKAVLKYRALVVNLALKDLRLQYKHSALGFFWSFLNPFFMLLIYTIAFKFILKSRVPHFTLFLLVAELPWNWLQTVILTGTNSLVNNANLINKVYFPRETIPVSVLLAATINFLLTFLTIFISMALAHVWPSWNLLWLPVILLNQLLFLLGAALFLSILTVRFRDIYHFVQVGMVAWFYLSPVVYPLSDIPARYQLLAHLNPMADFIQQYRAIIIAGNHPYWWQLVVTMSGSLLIVMFASNFFKTKSRNIAEYL